jgi:shikimate kinase
MAVGAPRVIVLVGLPGSGKSTVGPIVAGRLDWRFIDLDREIERQHGGSVATIFGQMGETAFRRLEHAATRQLLDAEGLVLAPGGGWALDPRNLDVFRDRAVTVYLRVSPEVAHRRMSTGVESRPLLAGADPLIRLEALLRTRESAYVQANHEVATDSMSPQQVADTIVALAMGSRRD